MQSKERISLMPGFNIGQKSGQCPVHEDTSDPDTSDGIRRTSEEGVRRGRPAGSATRVRVHSADEEQS